MKGRKSKTTPALRATSRRGEPRVHPFVGKKVHWTFFIFLLTLMKGGEGAWIPAFAGMTAWKLIEIGFRRSDRDA
jgi:hypothetical protein